MNEKIFNFIKSNTKYMVLILLGMVLLVVPSLSKKDSNKNDIEDNLKNTLEMVEGVGEIDVMITCNSSDTAVGAIIVAEGASNPVIKKMLQDSAVSVLNLPEYKVQVLTKKK